MREKDGRGESTRWASVLTVPQKGPMGFGSPKTRGCDGCTAVLPGKMTFRSLISIVELRKEARAATIWAMA